MLSVVCRDCRVRDVLVACERLLQRWGSDDRDDTWGTLTLLVGPAADVMSIIIGCNNVVVSMGLDTLLSLVDATQTLDAAATCAVMNLATALLSQVRNNRG